MQGFFRYIFGLLLFSLVVLTLVGLFAGDLEKPLRVGDHPVGVVRLEGEIDDALATSVVNQLWELADGDTRALVLRINSPGGGVGPSQEIYEELKRIRRDLEKPIVASFGGVAASGGYYAALGCDRIVANAGSITGSVGVIVQTLHAPELLNLAKLQPETVKSGRLKDSGSPLRLPNDEDRVLFRSMVTDIFDQFRGAVKANRTVTDEALQTISDGRVISGRQAKDLGLVDELGSMSRAAGLALELAGLDGRPRLLEASDDVPAWVRQLIEGVADRIVASLSASLGRVKIEYRAPL